MTDHMLDGMADDQPHLAGVLAGALAGITSRLVDDADASTVLRLVTDAGASLLVAAATGVMLSDPRGGVAVVAARTSGRDSWSCCKPRPTRGRAWTASPWARWSPRRSWRTSGDGRTSSRPRSRRAIER